MANPQAHSSDSCVPSKPIYKSLIHFFWIAMSAILWWDENLFPKLGQITFLACSVPSEF